MYNYLSNHLRGRLPVADAEVPPYHSHPPAICDQGHRKLTDIRNSAIVFHPTSSRQRSRESRSQRTERLVANKQVRRGTSPPNLQCIR